MFKLQNGKEEMEYNRITNYCPKCIEDEAN